MNKSFQSREVEEDERHVPLCVIRSIVARSMEPCRFSIQDSMLKLPVTKDNICVVIANHEKYGTKKSKGTRDSPGKSPLLQAMEGDVELSPLKETQNKKKGGSGKKGKKSDPLAAIQTWELRQQLEYLWGYVGPCDFDGWTFADLFAYQNAGYPVTTRKQRKALAKLVGKLWEDDEDEVDLDEAPRTPRSPRTPKNKSSSSSNEVVTLQEVIRVLDLEPATARNHPIIQTIFGSSCQIVPRRTLEHLLDAMCVPPNSLTFLTSCTKGVVGALRNMASFLPFLAIAIFTIVLIPKVLEIEDTFLSARAMLWPTVDDWFNECPNGPTNPCHFVTSTLKTVRTVSDAEYYFKEQLVDQLWGWDLDSGGLKRAPTVNAPMWGGSWLIGAMLIRISPPSEADEGHEEEYAEATLNCSSLNLTQPFWEPSIPQTFLCDASEAYLVPFSSTKEEALRILEPFSLRNQHDVVAIAQYAALNPQTGGFTWVTISTAIAEGGRVVPRSYVVAIDPDRHRKIVPFLISQCVQLLFSAVFVVYYSGNSGRPISALFTHYTVVPQVVSVAMVAASYAYLAPLSDLLQERTYLQAEYLPKDFDTFAENQRVGMDIFGTWVLLWLGLSLHYLRDVVSVGIVIRLLRVVVSEVAGLLVVFGVIYIGFVCCGMILFGSTKQEFTSCLGANAILFPYLWGDSSYELLTDQNPIIGGIFYYIYRVFIYYFVLNILIAVVTSPLASVTEAANLHLELYAAMARQVAKLPKTQQWLFEIRKILLPVIGTFSNTLVFFRVTGVWIRMHMHFSKLYQVDLRRHVSVIGKKARRTKDQDQDKDTPLLSLVLPDDEEEVNSDACDWLAEQMKVGVEVLRLVKKANDPAKTAPWDTPLWKGVVQHKSLPSVVTRELLKATIMLSTQIALIRDARLVQVLIHYDQAETKLRNAMDVVNTHRQQTADKENSIVKTVRSAMGLDLDHGTVGSDGGVSRPETADEEEPEGELHEIIKDLLQASDFSCGGLPSRQGRNKPELPVTLAPQRSIALSNTESSHLKRRMSVMRRSAAPPSDTSSSLSGSFSKKSVSKISEQLNFVFSQLLVRKLRSRRWFPLYLLFILLAYFLFTVPMLGTYQGLGWLNANVHGGLVEGTYPTDCADENCTRGFTHSKTFYDQGHLGDFYQYIDRVVITKLMFNVTGEVSPALDGERVYPVSWAGNIERAGPFHLRQLRGKQVPCHGISAFPCFGSNKELSTEDMIQPADSPYPPSAYEYRGVCSEIGNSVVRGRFKAYPCSGYSVAISTVEEMSYAKQWIDNATRFISLSGSFCEKNSDECDQVAFYWELGNGGGTAFVWTRSDLHVEQKIADHNHWAYAVMIAEAALYFFKLLRLIWIRCYRRNVIKSEQETPDSPFGALWAGVVSLLIYIFSVHDFDRNSLLTVVCVIFLTMRFLSVVGFPLAQLITRRAATIRRLMWLTASSCTIIVPFYVISFVAFVLSGHVLFGERVPKFGTMQRSMTTVGRAFLGDWDFERFGEFNTTVSGFCFTAVFFVVMTVFFHNVLLSLINGAAEAARSEAAALDYIDTFAELFGQRIYSGPLLESWLCWTIFPLPINDLLRRVRVCCRREESSQVAPKKPIGFTVSKHGRFPLPWETLFWMPSLGGRLMSELLFILEGAGRSTEGLLPEDESALEEWNENRRKGIGVVPSSLVYSAVMLVATELRAFEGEFSFRSLEDEAIELMLRLNQDGVVPDPSTLRYTRGRGFSFRSAPVRSSPPPALI